MKQPVKYLKQGAISIAQLGPYLELTETTYTLILLVHKGRSEMDGGKR